MMNFSNTLKTNNLKLTPQRLAILEIIDKSRHITIENIFKKVKKSFPSISLATVYKNINTMYDEAHIINRVQSTPSEIYYEITKERHSHFVCSNCDKIFDIHIDVDSNINDKLLQNQDISQIDSYETIVRGVCSKCSNK